MFLKNKLQHGCECKIKGRKVNQFISFACFSKNNIDHNSTTSLVRSLKLKQSGWTTYTWFKHVVHKFNKDSFVSLFRDIVNLHYFYIIGLRRKVPLRNLAKLPKSTSYMQNFVHLLHYQQWITMKWEAWDLRNKAKEIKFI